jgi:hypothetical protein
MEAYSALSDGTPSSPCAPQLPWRSCEDTYPWQVRVETGHTGCSHRPTPPAELPFKKARGPSRNGTALVPTRSCRDCYSLVLLRSACPAGSRRGRPDRSRPVTHPASPISPLATSIKVPGSGTNSSCNIPMPTEEPVPPGMHPSPSRRFGHKVGLLEKRCAALT